MKHDLITLLGMVRAARSGPKKPPVRLSSWLVAAGGIRDTNGEISAIGGAAKDRPGLINNHSEPRMGKNGKIRPAGMYLDDATHYAWEAGFIPSQDRPDIVELLELLDQDLNDSPVYSADDWTDLEAFESCEACRSELDRFGILPAHHAKFAKVESFIVRQIEALA